MTNKKDNKEIKNLSANNKKLPIQDTFKRFEKNERQRPKNKKSRPSRRSAKVRSEFDQKIISIRRVTRVVAGGRRFSFSIFSI